MSVAESSRSFGDERADAAGAIAATIAAARAVIFDVEGTLVDAVPLTLQCWRETLRHFGHEVTLETLRRHSGQDGADMLRSLLPAESSDRRKLILGAQGKRYRTHYLPHVKPFDAVAPLLQALRRAGRRVGLATDCSGDELARYSEICGIAEQVDAAACGDEVARGKPHGDLVALALHRLAVEPHEAVMVGDTPFDVTAANGLGAVAIAVLTGGYDARELRAAGARHACRNVAALLQACGET